MKTYKVIIHENGTIRWANAQGQFHRDEGPAIECADGTKYWYQNDKRHRLDGPAVEYKNGDKCWYQNGQLHRLDGPAVEWANGYKSWWQNDQRHRLDGPAIEYANGTKYWYIEGQELTEAAFLQKTKPSCEGQTVTINGQTYKLVKQ